MCRNVCRPTASSLDTVLRQQRSQKRTCWMSFLGGLWVRTCRPGLQSREEATVHCTWPSAHADLGSGQPHGGPDGCWLCGCHLRQTVRQLQRHREPWRSTDLGSLGWTEVAAPCPSPLRLCPLLHGTLLTLTRAWAPALPATCCPAPTSAWRTSQELFLLTLPMGPGSSNLTPSSGDEARLAQARSLCPGGCSGLDTYTAWPVSTDGGRVLATVTVFKSSLGDMG